MRTQSPQPGFLEIEPHEFAVFIGTGSRRGQRMQVIQPGNNPQCFRIRGTGMLLLEQFRGFLPGFIGRHYSIIPFKESHRDRPHRPRR